MNTLTISLPDSLRNQLEKLAEREGVWVDQLAASALTEKIAALMATAYLAGRAKRGNRSKFERALSKVADAEPAVDDAL